MTSGAASEALPPRGGPRGAAERWVDRTFDSLRMRDYRILWIGTTLSFIAFLMSSTAQGVVTYDLAGNNRAVGAVLFAQSLSMFILSPVAGVIADRWPKRMSLLICQVTVLATYLLIGALLATDRLTVPILAASGLVIGITFAAIRPVRSAYL
ncbi:MAG: MFS transporter, partial [Tepidiformaceae bacterium]